MFSGVGGLVPAIPFEWCKKALLPDTPPVRESLVQVRPDSDLLRNWVDVGGSVTSPVLDPGFGSFPAECKRALLPGTLAGPDPPPRDSSPMDANLPVAAFGLAGDGCTESDVVETSLGAEESLWKPMAAYREEAPPDEADDCAMT